MSCSSSLCRNDYDPPTNEEDNKNIDSEYSNTGRENYYTPQDNPQVHKMKDTNTDNYSNNTMDYIKYAVMLIICIALIFLIYRKE